MKGKRILSVILISLFFSAYSSAKSTLVQDISSEISKCQLKNKVRKKGNDFYENIRKQLINMDSLNFISYRDTVFILETLEYETGITHGMIWNKHQSLAYQYFQNKFTLNGPSLFDKTTVGLVEMWNIEKIKAYGEESKLISPSLYFASRAIIKQIEISVDCIAFNEFYLSQ